MRAIASRALTFLALTVFTITICAGTVIITTRLGADALINVYHHQLAAEAAASAAKAVK